METIKCPCCGGLTTNYLNCDYCGSYLVRFSKRNIEYDNTQLGKDAKVILGIQEEIQANIDEQINTHAQNHISSQSRTEKFDIEIRNPRSISDFVKKSYGNKIHSVYPTNPFDENEIAIILVIRVFEFSKSYIKGLSENDQIQLLEEKQKKDWLIHTGLLNLCAICEDPLSSIDGCKGVCHSYYLNFGQDIAGATRAISSFIFGVNQANIKKVHFTRSSISEIQYQASIRELKDDKKNEIKNRIIIGICAYITTLIFTFVQFKDLKDKKPIILLIVLFTLLFFLYILYILKKLLFLK